MAKKKDDKTEEVLIDALEMLELYDQKRQEKRDRQLWKEINLPCNLIDAISRLSKNDMDTIRKNFEFKNLTTLKKADLASELANLIPTRFKNLIYTLDQGRYDLIKSIAKNSGVITAPDIAAFEIELLIENSLAYPGIYNNQKVLFLPAELTSIMSDINEIELQKIIRRNTEWMQLTTGLLYYYGVSDICFIIEKVEQLTGKEIDFDAFFNVIFSASSYYEQIEYTSNGYKYFMVIDEMKIIKEHKMRPDVDYYPFTKKQLIKASEQDYIDKTPELDNLISFLLENYDIDEEDINEITLQLIDMINMGETSGDLVKYLQGWFEFPSFGFLEQLTTKLMELHNNTRQWALKGHTPSELFEEERKMLKQPESKVIDFKTYTKVGRNDPCPCGSGKKYKNCCGKL